MATPKDMAEVMRQVLQPLADDGVITHVYSPPVCICEDPDEVQDIACEAHKPPPAPYVFYERL